MATRFVTTLRFSLLSAISVVLLSYGTGLHAQDVGEVIELTGEASVVVFDDFVNGRSETGYFIRNLASNREVRLHFAQAAPASFVTGRTFTVRGRGRANGLELDVQSLTAMAAGDVTGGDETAGAPLAATDTRRVLTLLVDFNDATTGGTSNGVTQQDVKNIMFNNSKNVAHFYHTASLGTLIIDDDIHGDGQQDVYGPYLIDDNYTDVCDTAAWRDKARAAFNAANPGRSWDEWQHTSIILPNYWDNSFSCTWGGLAQVGCGSTCYAFSADPKSILHGVVIHELGHNLRFHHASTDSDNNGTIDSEYGDQSDMMSGSRNWMKFNAAHVEDQGWYDPVAYEIRTVVPFASAQSFDLLPMDDEADSMPGLRAIRVARDASSDYFISYRVATGHYNNVSSAYRNRLNIHYSPLGSFRSYFVTTLAAGQTYHDPHNNLIITATGEMDIGGATVMGVEICQDACSSIPAPSGLAASAAGTDRIELTWQDNSDNEDGFTLQQSGDGATWTDLASGLLSNSFSHTGLQTASTHHYRVQAYNSEEVSGWSNVAVETTDAIPPTAGFTYVANFTEVSFSDASADTDGTVVSWYWDFGDGNSSSARDPVHFYGTGGDYIVTLTVTDNHGAQASDSQPLVVTEPPWTDHFAQSELTSGGTVNGDYQDTWAADGVAEFIAERESGGKPNKRHSWLEHQWNFTIPAGAAATVMAVSSVFDADSGEDDPIVFEYSLNGGGWTSLFEAGGTSEAGLTPGAAGSVAIRVVDLDRTPGNRALDEVRVDFLRIRVDNGTPPPSNPPVAPSGLSAVLNGNVYNQVDLAWVDNSGNELGFRLERRVIDGGNWTLAAELGVDVTSYADSGLDVNTAYEYRLLAFNLDGESAAVQAGPVTTGNPPPPPTAGIALAVSPEKIKGYQAPLLTWTPANPDFATMDVYFDNDDSSPIVSGQASGWQHELGTRKGGPYAYQVCEAGSRAACSDWVQVAY